jgi:hypothetical protein
MLARVSIVGIGFQLSVEPGAWVVGGSGRNNCDVSDERSILSPSDHTQYLW